MWIPRNFVIKKKIKIKIKNNIYFYYFSTFILWILSGTTFHEIQELSYHLFLPTGLTFCSSQVIGRLFSPSQKLKKWTQRFRLCFQLGMGILNAPRKFFFVVYEPHRELRGLQGVRFQGKNCFTIGLKLLRNWFWHSKTKKSYQKIIMTFWYMPRTMHNWWERVRA